MWPNILVDFITLQSEGWTPHESVPITQRLLYVCVGSVRAPVTHLEGPLNWYTSYGTGCCSLLPEPQNLQGWNGPDFCIPNKLLGDSEIAARNHNQRTIAQGNIINTGEISKWILSQIINLETKFPHMNRFFLKLSAKHIYNLKRVYESTPL